MTGGERVYASLRLLVDNWDSVPVRLNGQSLLLSEIDDEKAVARQVLRYLATRHLPEALEGPGVMPGPVE